MDETKPEGGTPTPVAKPETMRFRHVYMGVGSILVILLLLLSDPDAKIIHNLPIGGGTLATLVILLKTVLYAAVFHLTRKGLMDYLDLEEFFNLAKASPTGAGLAVVGAGLFGIAIAIVIYAATV
jgi:hypothetical protein